MGKIFQAVINCDATASAIVFVKAEDEKKAPLAILDAASELPYTLSLNTPYAPEFWLEKSDEQVIEVEINTPVSLFAFQALDDDALLAWPSNADQPHTKADFLAAAFDNQEWAYKLYDAYIQSDEDVCLDTYLEQVDFKDLIFGSETNYQQLARVLKNANALKVDDSPLILSWGESFVEDVPDNQIFQFTWSVGGFDYSCILTEEGVSNGAWVGNTFTCEDLEGEKTVIEFFAMTPIRPFGELS